MWEKNCCKTIDKVWLLIWLFYRKSIAEGHEQYFSHIFQNFLFSLKYHRPIIEPHFLTIKPFCHTFPTFFIDNFSNVKWRKIIILKFFNRFTMLLLLLYFPIRFGQFLLLNKDNYNANCRRVDEIRSNKIPIFLVFQIRNNPMQVMNFSKLIYSKIFFLTVLISFSTI